MPTNVDSLETLLARTRDLFMQHKKTIISAVVVLGLIAGATQLLITSRMQGPLIESVSNTMGIDPSLMQEVMNEGGEQDGQAMQELMQALEGRMEDFDAMSDEEQENFLKNNQWQIYAALLPAFSVSALVMVLITLFAHVFYALFALTKSDDVKMLSRMSLRKLIPVIGLWLWVFIRTFMWIPFIGVITAIILGPRFVASPVYLLRDNKGILESAHLSYQNTRGYWGKIFGNLLVIGFAVMLVKALVSIILGILLSVLPFVSTLALGIVEQASVAVLTIFATLLGLSIVDDGMPTKAAPAKTPPTKTPASKATPKPKKV